MAGQSDYLPPGLPLNRAKWPQECQLVVGSNAAD